MEVGTIVRISGLQSAAGQGMNEKLGEIFPQPGARTTTADNRLKVVLTLDRKVKIAAIKPENLQLVLTDQEAAVMSVKTERDLLELGPTVIREHMRQSNRFNVEELPGMSAAEIVAGIRENNAHLMQALKMPVEFRRRYQIDSATIVGMLEGA